MHVGFDLLFLVPGRSGGRETHARGLLRALRVAAPDLRVTAFLNAETAAAGSGFWSEAADRAVVLPRASGARRLPWAVGELAALPRAAARAGVDVLHSPANFAPLHGPFARVLTLHDLLHRERPELAPRALRLATEALLRPAVARAHRVITVSETSRRAIVEQLGLPAGSVAVTPNGLSPVAPGDPAAARAELAAGTRPVVLSVATDLPHKNLGVLPAALSRLPAGQRPVLAFAGAGTDSGRLAALCRAQGVAEDVRLLGAVAPSRLDDLYAAAAAVVTATLYEGFGLPVLEAMARGLPVVCSDLPVLREVAGDTALYADPEDPAALAAALSAVLAPADAQTGQRVARGRERAARFTWRRTAEQTLAVYAAALESARSSTANTRLV